MNFVNWNDGCSNTLLLQYSYITQVHRSTGCRAQLQKWECKMSIIYIQYIQRLLALWKLHIVRWTQFSMATNIISDNQSSGFKTSLDSRYISYFNNFFNVSWNNLRNTTQMLSHFSLFSAFIFSSVFVDLCLRDASLLYKEHNLYVSTTNNTGIRNIFWVLVSNVQCNRYCSGITFKHIWLNIA